MGCFWRGWCNYGGVGVGGVIGWVCVGGALYPSMNVNPKVDIPCVIWSQHATSQNGKTFPDAGDVNPSSERLWASPNPGHPAEKKRPGVAVVPDDAVASVQIRGDCVPSKVSGRCSTLKPVPSSLDLREGSKRLLLSGGGGHTYTNTKMTLRRAAKNSPPCPIHSLPYT